VNVNAVRSRRQLRNVEFYLNPRVRLRKNGRSDFLTLRADDIRVRGERAHLPERGARAAKSHYNQPKTKCHSHSPSPDFHFGPPAPESIHPLAFYRVPLSLFAQAFRDSSEDTI
jgi:hypothetical protein